MGAKYILRFDDFCPTLNWDVWEKIQPLLCSLNIKPLLAVVPDNQDRTLMVGRARSDFWEQARSWQTLGWEIAMHGYQHIYETNEAGMIGINPFSEFAGLSPQIQERKLTAGLHILQQEGIRSRTWIAPGHSFDRTTVFFLRRLGMKIISDGLFFRPIIDVNGLVWIPQQFGSFHQAPFGVWTICVHFNHFGSAALGKFLDQLKQFAPYMISVEEAFRLAHRQHLTLGEKLFCAAVPLLRRLRRTLVSQRPLAPKQAVLYSY